MLTSMRTLVSTALLALATLSMLLLTAAAFPTSSDAAKGGRSCAGVGGGGPGEGEWGAFRIKAKNVSCKRAQALITQCADRSKEPSGWTYLFLSASTPRLKLVRGRQVVSWSPAGSGISCAAPGKKCGKSRQHDGYVLLSARNTSCASARKAFKLWSLAGYDPPKERPGAGWTCGSELASDYPPPTRCERGNSFVRFVTVITG